MLERTEPHAIIFARCPETGAKVEVSRKQWILVYDRNGVYKTRHWQRAKVSAEQILERAQKSLDKIVAELAEEGE